MNSEIIALLLVVFIRSVRSDFSETGSINDLGTGSINDLGTGSINGLGKEGKLGAHGKFIGGGKEDDGRYKVSLDQHLIKPITSEPSISFFGQGLNEKQIQQIINKRTKEEKLTKPSAMKNSKNFIQKIFKKLKKNKYSNKMLQKDSKESKLLKTILNTEANDPKKDVHHITRKNSYEINENKLRKDTYPRFVDSTIADMVAEHETNKENRRKIVMEKPISLKDTITSFSGKQPIFLNGREYDDAENLIEGDEDPFDRDMKRLKKSMWLGNLIPKSNKFLYNNKKYHDHMVDIDAINKHKHVKKQEPVIKHKRNKRAALSSIFVQLPKDEDESNSNDEYSSTINEEPRNKKSRGSTTVCLEIKGDSTKPSSTVCGPEFKPNLPQNPQIYEFGNQNYAPNNFYYSDPQPDQAIWSVNPLHDPNYYSSINNYKYQSANRENHYQPQDKYEANNGQVLNKNEVKPTSQITAQDKEYQENKTSMTEKLISPEDKTKTLNSLPQATNNVVQDSNSKTEREQTPRSLLSENSENSEDVSGVLRNKFKDLDLTLDGDTSETMNSYASPELDVQSSPMWSPYGDAFENSFNSDQINPLSMLTGEFKNVDTSDQRKVSEGENQTVTPAESVPKVAYEYYDRGYPYRPSYPYEYSRPYSYGSSHRPYIYDRYDPYCRSKRCRAAASELDFDRSAQVIPKEEEKLSPVDTMPFLQNQPRDGQVFEDVPNTFVGIPMSFIREDQPSQFRGEVYYGRPYPYRPPYEYHGSSYPYSSRPHYGSSYPYEQPYHGSSYYDRPHYGSTYPYDPNCRTADGRSCRESEEDRSSDNPESSIPNGPTAPLVPRSPNPVTYKDVNSYILQEAAPFAVAQDGILGNPLHLPLFRTLTPSLIPMQPILPTGLACNLVHGIGVGAGHGHLNGGLTGIGTHGVFGTTGGIGHGHGLTGLGGIGLGHGIGGFGSHGLQGLALGNAPLTGSHQTLNVLSGVGTHGIGGSHGLVRHHGLLGEKTPETKDTEENEEETYKEAKHDEKVSQSEPNVPAVTTKTDTKPIPSVEEIKNKVTEKLRAAEEKLRSSKNAILEKINKTVEKGKKIQQNEKTIEKERNSGDSGTVTDAETKGTFGYPSIVQFPTGGRIALNPGMSRTNVDARTMEFLTGSQGTPVINLRTPLGGSLTYDSPLFRTGLLGGSFLERGSFLRGRQFPSWLSNGYRSADDVSQCVCTRETSSCVCPVTKAAGSDPLTRNAHYFDLSPNFQRAAVSPQYVENYSYNPENGPILGIVPLERSISFKAPEPEPVVTIQTEQKSPITPCVANQLLGSPTSQVAPIISQQPLASPQEVSYRVPTFGLIPIQTQSTGIYQDLSKQHPIQSPMVGFASLSEMKEKENQLKETHPESFGYESYNQFNPNDNINLHRTYEELYNDSLRRQSNGKPTETFKSSAASTLKKPSELEKLPSKILTAKPLKPATPILKLPSPKPLKTTQKQPC